MASSALFLNPCCRAARRKIGARAEVGGETCELGPGDCCFFPPDMPHVFTVTSDEPVKVLVIYSPPYEESPDRVVR